MSKIISDTTTKLVGLMAQCCVRKQIQPVDLPYGVFRTWLRAEQAFDTSALRELSTYVTSIGGFNAIKSAFFTSVPSVNTIQKLELKEMAKIGKSAINALASQDLFLSRLEDLMNRMFTKHAPKAFGYSVKRAPKDSVQRMVTLVLSDLHLGSNLDPREVPHRFGAVEEARRLAWVTKSVCEFKRDYRKQTKLTVLLLGDLIKGLIHASASGAKLAEQVADAVWLLYQVFVILGSQYRSVAILCSSGNHDRNPGVHADRAINDKWDSFATHIYIAIKAALAHIDNVTVEIPRTPFVEYSPFAGQRVYATHGDTCLSVGNVGRSLNTEHLESQMLAINDGETQRGKESYRLFIVGHGHVGMLSYPATGALCTNGCLIPPDPFTVSIAHPSSRNGQYLIESTPDFLVGDSRFVQVGPKQDQAAALDKIIRPWNGEF